MAHSYPYFEHDFVHPSEYIPPLEVCIDNETSDDFTIIKINGANKHDILFKIVQILSDLDLIISKSYISSDGDWFMDAFHVTNQHGHKLKDPTLICYIQYYLNIAQKQDEASNPPQVKISHGRIVNFNHFATTALELCFLDRPDIFPEVIDVLSKHSYVIDSGELWTHNGRAACIIYIKDNDTNLPIFDQERFNYLGDYLASLMKTHHFDKELWELRLRNPSACRIHTERRLHQLLQNYKDYEVTVEDNEAEYSPQVSIERWNERDYLVVNVKSKDRPKLIFDTLCALMDLNFEVFHGFVSTNESVADQEYFVRRMNGHTMLDEMEKNNMIQNLTTAVERRISQGLRLNVHTFDRPGLLSLMSKELRENNLSLKMAKFSKDDYLAIGTFCVTDDENVDIIDQQRLDTVCNKIGGDVYFEKKNDCSISSAAQRRWSLFSKFYELGRSLWSHIKSFFRKFSFIR